MSSGVHAVVIEVAPSNQPVNLGDSVSVDIDIRDLGDLGAPSVSTFDITVDFDTTLLDLDPLTGVTFGAGLDLGIFGSIQDSASTPGGINIFEVSLEGSVELDAQQPDAFTLFTLTFDTLLPGTSALMLTLNDSADTSVPDPQQLSDVTINDGSIRIVDPTGVSVPTTLALLGLGLCLLGRRQRSTPPRL